ncbi:hypothetical protein E2C01_032473 [Portunus trituberculatus]|uniref:Uncharacterized protein n=1 Tax=Portunus trituberculatus TaxID=210409 RepID=A0A5B7F2W8_PORTR|nr:hypothetical protein [Portunus trituberculatus]
MTNTDTTIYLYRSAGEFAVLPNAGNRLHAKEHGNRAAARAFGTPPTEKYTCQQTARLTEEHKFHQRKEPISVNN